MILPKQARPVVRNTDGSDCVGQTGGVEPAAAKRAKQTPAPEQRPPNRGFQFKCRNWHLVFRIHGDGGNGGSTGFECPQQSSSWTDGVPLRKG